MKKRWILIPVCAVLILVLAGWTYLETAVTPVEEAVEQFFSLLAAGDVEGAKDLAAGQTLYLLSRPQDAGIPAGKVVRQDVEVTASGNGWAQARATVEIELADGSVDLGWYALEMVRANGSWNVVDLRPVPPYLSGVGLPAWGEDVAAAKEVFEDYLRKLSQGSYAEAAKLTVGPARAAQEQQAPAFGKAPLFKEVGEVLARPLWRRGKYLKLLAEYEVDGRPVKVVMLMYRTARGWRVAGVSQT